MAAYSSPCAPRFFNGDMIDKHRHSAQLHLDPSLEPSNMTGNEQFVFALHPHGILADYRILMDGVIDEYFPKVMNSYWCASSVIF